MAGRRAFVGVVVAQGGLIRRVAGGRIARRGFVLGVAAGLVAGLAGGLALGFEAGAQGPQSWTDFTTPDPMRIEDFQCPGRVTSVGGHVIYGATYSWLTFIPIVERTVKIASSGHGWGFGGGLETIVGAWILRKTSD